MLRLFRRLVLLSLASIAAAGAHAQAPAMQISNTGEHACVLTAASGVACWGRNDEGQLGNGSAGAAFSSGTPVPVTGLSSGVVAVVTGYNHACALTTGGAVKCWGLNDEGQLGSNTGTNSALPIDVSLGAPVAAIAAGWKHTCVLTTAGAVQCWGGNSRGQLGDGSTTPRAPGDNAFPIASGAKQISATIHTTCATLLDGTVKCWGDNTGGQTGDPGNGLTLNTTPYTVKLADHVTNLGGVDHVATGGVHTCAALTNGSAMCWGANEHGQLSNAGSVSTAQPDPSIVTGLPGPVVRIDAGYQHTCAIVTGGAAFCWGNNDYAQLGNDFNTHNPTPTPQAVGAIGVSAIDLAAGADTTCFLLQGGSVRCAGNTAEGQVGNGSTAGSASYSATPVVGYVANVSTSAIATGGQHTCQIVAGAARCWGRNAEGQLGNGDVSGANSSLPVQVSGLASGTSGIAVGTNFSCALVAGSVSCWGDNSAGQAGDGQPITIGNKKISPSPVVGLSGVTAIAAGENHACALLGDQTVKCWGDNFRGQLGDGTNVGNSTPVTVSGLSGVTAIFAGGQHTCALTGTAPGAQCWGWNSHGQLGNNGTTDSNVPVNVTIFQPDPVPVTLALGGEFTCGLTSVGSGVKCWGRNNVSQLGNDNTTDSLVPVDVVDATFAVAGLSAGSQHACAYATSGDAGCWGLNSSGQVGNNTTSNAQHALLTSGYFTGVIAIIAGQQHSCALLTGGFAQCWGDNTSGQVGDGTNTQRLMPVEVLQNAQWITFALPATVPYGTPTTLSATSRSGLPVGFDGWTSSTCSVSGTTLTPNALGLCGVRATQPGGGSYLGGVPYFAAPFQERLIQVVQGDQAISFGTLANKAANDPPFTVSATGGGSGNPVVFSVPVTTSVCNASGTNGSTITLTGQGTCTVAADQAGNALYNAAPQVTQSFAVGVGTQAITFNPLPDKTYGDAAFTVSATGGGSGNPVTFSVPVTTSVCNASGTNGTTITITAAGTCTIAADQAGNANFSAAATVTQSFTVAKATQSITFGALPNRSLGDPPFTVTATGGASTSPVTFASTTTSVCTSSGADGSTITMIALGACTIAADQAGDANYLAAPQKLGTFQVVDGTAPETTITGKPRSISHDHSPKFTFTSTEPGTFECQLDGGGFSACTSPKQYTSVLNGSHTFDVRAIDTTSNVDPTPATYSWTIQNPGNPSIGIVSKPVITSANQAAYSIGGTCSENGRTVNAEIGSVAATGTCGTPSAGQFVTTPVNVSGLPQGTVALSATITDAVFDSATDNDVTTKDTAGPVLTLDPLDGIYKGNAAAYAFSGTCETGGSAVGYTLTSGASVTGSVPCSASAFVVSGLDVSTLSDGIVAFAITQTDSLSNPASASGGVLKDTAIDPIVTIHEPLLPVNAANQAAYTVTGACSENGLAVTVTVGGTVTASPTCTAGHYSTGPLNLSALADSPTLAVAASHFDAEGDLATAHARILKDTVAAAPVVTAPSGTIVGNQPTVTGTSEASASIDVRIDGASVGTTTADGSGNWSFPLPAPLAPLAHTAAAVATDAAGNVSALSTVSNFFIPSVTVSPTTLPGGTVGVAYSQAVTASGGSLAPYTFTVTAGALPTNLGLASGGALTGTPTAAGTFNFTITATDSDTTNGPFSGNRAYSIVIAKASQAITFGALGGKTFGDAPFTVSATGGGSTSAVVFSSTTPSVCTTSGTNGTTVTIGAAGNCTIAADQAGDANYDAAPQVTQSFTVAQAPQTINFGALGGKTFGDAPFTVSATGGASGNAVTFSSTTTAVCTTSGTNGTTVTIVAAGGCSITANQAGNANFAGAAPVTQSFTVAKATPGAIGFGALGGKTYGDAPFTVSATGGGASTPVTFSSTTTSVCTTSGTNGTTVTIVGAGTCSITANQAADANFNAATSVTQSFAVAKATPGAIGFGALGGKTYGDAPFTVSATGGGASTPVTFSSTTTSVCTTSGTNGTTVTIVGAGTCSITANQAADANFNAATPVTQSFAVAKATPGTIVFGALPDRFLTDPPFTATATGGGSSSPVTFSSTTTSICTSSGTNGATITMVALGTCTLAANQAGDANFNAAAQVLGSFQVKDGTPPHTTILTKPTDPSSSATATFTFSADKPGSTFECKLDGGSFASCTSPKQYTGLADGSHTVTIRATDTVANVEPSPPSYTWTVDTGVPTIAFTSKPAINGGNQAAYSVTGTCSENGRAVSVQIGSVAATATCGTPSSGQFATTAVDVSALAQGTVALSATLIDVASNSDTAIDSITKSTAGTALALDALDAITKANKAAYGFSGLCTNGGGNVGYTLTSGANVTGSVACTAGAFVVSALDVSTLNDGTVTFALTQGAGNAGGSVLKNTVDALVTIDTPAAINAANKAAYTITGNCSENTQAVDLTIGGTLVVHPTCTNAAFTTGALDLTALADSLAFSVAADHTAPATGHARANASVLKDTAAPAAPVVTAPSGTISVNPPTVTGTSEANASIDVRIDGASVGTTTANGSGNWSYPIAAPLAPLAHTAAAVATDTAGNVSALSNVANFFIPSVTVSPTTLPGGTVGVAYSQTVTASGGSLAPYTFTVTSGALPTNVALASGGAISGTPTAAGTFNFTITATDNDTTNGPFSGNRAYSVVIAKGSQTITFGALGGKTFGDPPFTVSATGGGSTSPVVFSSTTPAVCTTSGTNGTTVTIGAVGNCTIRASQAGDVNYNAAPNVDQSFTIGSGATVPSAPVIGAATPLNGQAQIAFTPPASNGGSAILDYRVTCNPGGATQVGAGSPITVSGLANLTTYTCSVTARNAVGNSAASGTVTVTPSPNTLVVSPASIAFGGQSMGTTSPSTTVTVTNNTSGTVTISSVAASAQFARVTSCGSLAVGQSCTIDVGFSPSPAAGAVNSTASVSGSLTITSDASGSPHVVTLSGTAEKSLVTHYYRSILRRAPDAGGKNFWIGEANRMLGHEANVNETWFAMAQFFYFSAEYTALNRTDAEFVTDLYNTFFNRPPDAGGLSFWVGQINQGMPRGVILTAFMFSTEFTSFAQNIFGNTAARAEIDMVGDFYRGLVARLPDDSGFDHWIAQFRGAQCSGANAGAAIYALVDSISSTFANGTEYANRARNNAQYVSDLYNAFLRRGGDLTGVQYWINQLDTTSRTRNEVRQVFIQSPEFNGRVQAVVAQGCKP